MLPLLAVSVMECWWPFIGLGSGYPQTLNLKAHIIRRYQHLLKCSGPLQYSDMHVQLNFLDVTASSVGATPTSGCAVVCFLDGGHKSSWELPLTGEINRTCVI